MWLYRVEVLNSVNVLTISISSVFSSVEITLLSFPTFYKPAEKLSVLGNDRLLLQSHFRFDGSVGNYVINSLQYKGVIHCRVFGEIWENFHSWYLPRLKSECRFPKTVFFITNGSISFQAVVIKYMESKTLIFVEISSFMSLKYRWTNFFQYFYYTT